MLQVTQCLLSQVINATELPVGRAGVPCLNVKFSAKKTADLRDAGFHTTAFAGSGLYALCFDDRLIYLGSYLGSGKNGAFLNGNLLRSRIWTHMGAITLRGHRVHMSRRKLEALGARFGSDHPLVQQLLNASDTALLHKDAGCLAPFPRMVFAAEHWDIFSQPVTEEFLDRFKLIYVRVSSLPEGMSPQQLKAALLATEKKLIKEFAPSCNSTHIVQGVDQVPTSVEVIDKRMQAEMLNLMGDSATFATGS